MCVCVFAQFVSATPVGPKRDGWRVRTDGTSVVIAVGIAVGMAEGITVGIAVGDADASALGAAVASSAAVGESVVLLNGGCTGA